jgi:hypothetical protein
MGSNKWRKYATFGTYVRNCVRNVRTKLEQHCIHRQSPTENLLRCML